MINRIYREKILFLFVGGINTIAGYIIGVMALMMLKDKVSLFIIGFFASIVAITFSYMMQKICVFRTKGFSLTELRRALVTYGAIAIMSGILTDIIISNLTKEILYAQFFVMIFGTTISFVGLKYYVFK